MSPDEAAVTSERAADLFGRLLRSIDGDVPRHAAQIIDAAKPAIAEGARAAAGGSARVDTIVGSTVTLIATELAHAGLGHLVPWIASLAPVVIAALAAFLNPPLRGSSLSGTADLS